MSVLKSWGRAVCCSRPENAARGGWSGLEFHATAFGFLFGTFGVWSLPVIMKWHGGVAFLVPLLFWVLVLGLPMVLLELYVGQYSGQGLLTSWRHMTPVFSGIGYAMFFIVSCCSIYVPVFIAPCIFYFVASFHSPLPWTDCKHIKSALVCRLPQITKEECKSPLVAIRGVCCKISEYTYGERRNTNEERWYFNGTMSGHPVSFYNREQANVSPYGISLLGGYFRDHITGSDTDTMTEVMPYLLVCMLVVWVLVGLKLSVGPRSLGKVSYVTTILPLILLAALLVRMVTLPGAVTGLNFLLVQDWSVLMSLGTWADAGVYVCSIYGLGHGVLQTLSSYNHFNNDILRDSILFVILPLIWSLLWGLVHFGAFGYLAQLKNDELKYTASGGVYAAFQVMADVFANMPNGEVWARVYYLALLLACLGMQFSLVETLSISLKDQFPKLQKVWWAITPAICVALFSLGIPLCLNNGYFLMEDIKKTLRTMNIFYILFAEILCVAFYGVLRYRHDLATILGRRWAICIPSFCCGYFLAAFWYAIVPISVLFLMSIGYIRTYFYYFKYYYRMVYYMPRMLSMFLLHIAFFIILTTCTVWFGVYLCCFCRKRTTSSPGVYTKKWGPSLQKYRDLVPHLATRAAPESAAESETLLEDSLELQETTV